MLLQNTSGSAYSLRGGIKHTGENNTREYSQYLANKIVHEIL
jgi:hypothetical protein